MIFRRNTIGLILAVLGVSRASDLGCRFNKIILRPDSTVPADFDFLPMLPSDYPISGDKAGFLANSTYCPSVVQANDYECHGHDIAEIIATISDGAGAGSPPYPGESTSYWGSTFWAQLEDVIDAQIQRNSNENALCNGMNYMDKLPSWWQHFSIKDCADAVHDEFPGIHHIELIKKFLSEGMETDSSIIPDRCETPFLRGPVMLGDLNAWSVGVVGPLNFAAKYFVGYPRPEEVVYKIYTGELNATHGVPGGIINKVLGSFTLAAATDFTAYPEGSPQHPSWPAMHSAASSASLWLAVVGNLTSEQECEARKIDNAVASARTVAGVHYQWDNCGGLDMGQEVIARFLGAYLEEKYGANKAAVDAKIAQKRFAWCGNDPLANC